jgi:hypothetical protein
MNQAHSHLTAFWRSMAANPAASVFGHVRPDAITPGDIAQQISTEDSPVQGKAFGDSQAVFVTLNGLALVYPGSELRTDEGVYAEYTIRHHDSTANTNDLHDRLQLNLAAMRWIRAVGGQWLHGEESGIDELFATTSMFLSTLREDSTTHLQPLSSHLVTGWTTGDDDLNIALLAGYESELTHERLPVFYRYAYDANRNRIVGSGGEEISPLQVREILQRTDPHRNTGISEASIARALATRSALRGDGYFRPGGRGSVPPACLAGIIPL